MIEPKKYNVMITMKSGRKHCLFASNDYDKVEKVLDSHFTKLNKFKFVPVQVAPKVYFANVDEIAFLTLENRYEQLIDMPEED